MAWLRDVFKNVEEWTRRVLGPAKEPEAAASIYTPEVRAFLYATDWVPQDSSHHKAVWFDIYRNECHFQAAKDGTVWTVENFTTADALSYLAAPSRGIWYWDHVRVRGKGNAKKTQKPFRYGL